MQSAVSSFSFGAVNYFYFNQGISILVAQTSLKIALGYSGCYATSCVSFSALRLICSNNPVASSSPTPVPSTKSPTSGSSNYCTAVVSASVVNNNGQGNSNPAPYNDISLVLNSLTGFYQYRTAPSTSVFYISLTFAASNLVGVSILVNADAACSPAGCTGTACTGTCITNRALYYLF